MLSYVGLVALVLGVLAWRRLGRHLLARWPARRTAILVACGVGALVCSVPGLAMSIGGWSGMRHVSRATGDTVALFLFGAQFAVVLYWIFVGLSAPLRMLGRRLRTTAPPLPAFEKAVEAAPEPSPAVGRRALLAAGAAAVPAFAIGGAVYGVGSARRAPVVTTIFLPVRRELTALHGLKIAQISDVHVGSYMDLARLEEIRDAMNSLGADIHVITGDLLDNHVEQLEHAQALVRGLAPKKAPVYLCLGNHEYMAARTASVKTIRGGLEEAGGRVLLDESEDVRIGGDRLWIGGIDHPRAGKRQRPGEPPARSTDASLDLALASMKDDGAPRILLSHHPRTFVEARERPIDIMLSGHTHGGQLVAGRVGERTLSPMLPFEHYHNGLYRHGDRRLYVNAGAGGWLPIRVNCPPEISVVELVPA